MVWPTLRSMTARWLKNRTEQPYPLYFIVCKFLKRVTWPWPHPFRDDFLLTGWEWIWSTYKPNLKSFSALVMKLWMAVQNAEKGWYRVVRSWAMKLWSYEWQCKMQKRGGIGWLGHGQCQSWFDRVYTNSYSSLIETMRQYCIVFETQQAICRKSPILTYPTCNWYPHWGWPWWKYAKICGNKKLQSP